MTNKRPRHICQRCLSQWTYEDICDVCHAQKYFNEIANDPLEFLYDLPEFEQKEEYILRPKRNWSDGIATRIRVDLYRANN